MFARWKKVVRELSSAIRSPLGNKEIEYVTYVMACCFKVVELSSEFLPRHWRPLEGRAREELGLTHEEGEELYEHTKQAVVDMQQLVGLHYALFAQYELFSKAYNFTRMPEFDPNDIHQHVALMAELQELEQQHKFEKVTIPGNELDAGRAEQEAVSAFTPKAIGKAPTANAVEQERKLYEDWIRRTRVFQPVATCWSDGICLTWARLRVMLMFVRPHPRVSVTVASLLDSLPSIEAFVPKIGVNIQKFKSTSQYQTCPDSLMYTTEDVPERYRSGMVSNCTLHVALLLLQTIRTLHMELPMNNHQWLGKIDALAERVACLIVFVHTETVMDAHGMVSLFDERAAQPPTEDEEQADVAAASNSFFPKAHVRRNRLFVVSQHAMRVIVLALRGFWDLQSTMLEFAEFEEAGAVSEEQETKMRTYINFVSGKYRMTESQNNERVDNSLRMLTSFGLRQTFIHENRTLPPKTMLVLSRYWQGRVFSEINNMLRQKTAVLIKQTNIHEHLRLIAILYLVNGYLSTVGLTNFWKYVMFANDQNRVLHVLRNRADAQEYPFIVQYGNRFGVAYRGRIYRHATAVGLLTLFFRFVAERNLGIVEGVNIVKELREMGFTLGTPNQRDATIQRIKRMRGVD